MRARASLPSLSVGPSRLSDFDSCALLNCPNEYRARREQPMSDDQIRTEIARQINATLRNLARQLRAATRDPMMPLSEQVTLELAAAAVEAAMTPN